MCPRTRKLLGPGNGCTLGMGLGISWTANNYCLYLNNVTSRSRDNPTEGTDITNFLTFDLKTQPPTVDYVVELPFIGRERERERGGRNY